MALLAVATAPAGCGAGSAGSNAAAPQPQDDIVASIINVTPFEVSVVLSGVLDDTVDTVRRTVPTLESTDVGFTCVGELVVGDPLEIAAAGVVIEADAGRAELPPFALLRDAVFVCGDIVEIIISGTNAETFAADVFILTP